MAQTARRGLWLLAAVLAVGASSPAAGGDTPAGSASPPAAPPATKTDMDKGDRVWVELIATDPRAVLERRPEELEGRGDLSGVEGWRGVCVAPCRASVRRDDRLRVGGSGLSELYFYVPEGPGPYTVYAEPGSAAAETAGFTLILAGAAAILTGTITTVALASGPTKNADPESAAVVMLHASVTTIILGGVLLGIGVPIRVAGGGDIKVEQRAPVTAAPEPSQAAAREPRFELAEGLYLTPRGLVF